MQAKRLGCVFNVLLLLIMLTNSVTASPHATVSFGGGGVVVDLTYPEEAQPKSTIMHEIMITSTVPNILQNFTIVIKASVNSSWVEIKSAQDTTGPSLPKGYNLTISLPQDANGKLQCYIFVETSSIKDLSITLYSTLVSEPTFSEMQVLYNEMLSNYAILQNQYETLLGDYNTTFTSYTALLTEYNVTSALYEEQVSAYQEKLEEYNELSIDYNNIYNSYTSKITEFSNLQKNSENLNTTLNELQASYTLLETRFEELNEDYAYLEIELNNLEESLDSSQNELSITSFVMVIFLIAVAVLISFILYLKRKGEEPYIVIRKETVSMKSDEDK